MGKNAFFLSNLQKKSTCTDSTIFGMKFPQLSEQNSHILRNKNAIIFGKMHKIFANIIFFVSLQRFLIRRSH